MNVLYLIFVVALAGVVVAIVLSHRRRLILVSREGTCPQFPQVVFITYRTVDELPRHVVHHIRDLNPSFRVEVSGDAECVTFLHRHFGSEHARFFLDIPDGPIKADFWRACITYAHGGVYLDADARLMLPLTDFVLPDVDLCTSGSMTRGRVNPIIIVAKPRNAILRRCIDILMSKRGFPYSYWGYSICPALFQAIDEITPAFNHNGEGVYDTRDGQKVQLLYEQPWHREADARTMWQGRVCLHNHTDCYDSKSHKFVKK